MMIDIDIKIQNKFKMKNYVLDIYQNQMPTFSLVAKNIILLKDRCHQ